ncbi:MAG TPA: flagellar hook assembly protein FlgD [Deltaproteobacteria bacterium]|nr:flagellar hook assembly protein FlgD [Deltaproteobacteria bacterium]
MATLGLENILATQSIRDASSARTMSDKVAEQKDMFLNLLVRQLQYQDPLNPMENTEFTAQLAQFSQLESLNSMNSNLEVMAKFQSSMNSMQALSFIGRQISASGNIVNYTGGDSSLDFTLEDNASDVLVTVFSSSGSIVRTMEMKNVLQGQGTCVWNGMDNKGEPVPSGSYYFSVQAKGFSGDPVMTSTYADGTVTGVRFEEGTIYLQLGDKEVRLADITRISG